MSRGGQSAIIIFNQPIDMTDVEQFLARLFPPAPPWMTESAHDLLREAEQRYSSRDQAYKFMGVVTDPDGPFIRFAFQGPGIFIAVTPSALQFPDQALHQIAHEVIHLLGPNRDPPTILYEEGLAVWFSIYVPKFRGNGYVQDALSHYFNTPSAQNYLKALNLFQEVETTEPNAARRLRERTPNLHELNPTMIREILPLVSKGLSERMCERITMR